MPRPLAVEQEALDVRRQLGMGLVAVAAGHLDQLEAVAGFVVRVGAARAQRARPIATGCSSSCASSSGSTGSVATSTIASIARMNSATESSTRVADVLVAHVESIDRSRISPRSRRRGSRRRRPRRTPAIHDDLDVAEALGLVELDHALLEQLEHGEEAHDHLQPLDEAVGQPAERDAPDAGQLVDQLGHRVGDAGAHRGDVEQVDDRHRLAASVARRYAASQAPRG